MRTQIDALRNGVEVVVGTPGRMEDLMNDGYCRLGVSAYAFSTGSTSTCSSLRSCISIPILCTRACVPSSAGLHVHLFIPAQLHLYTHYPYLAYYFTVLHITHVIIACNRCMLPVPAQLHWAHCTTVLLDGLVICDRPGLHPFSPPLLLSPPPSAASDLPGAGRG